jgi:hypothetical protein
MRYETLEGGLRALREAYGLFPEDLNDYQFTRPDEGFLLGWASEVVAPLDLRLPPEIKFSTFGAQHGYLRWDKIHLDLRRSIRVPRPGRPALVPAPRWMVGDESFEDAPILRDRYIPTAVRKAVMLRDGGRCAMCGSTATPLHFDHKYPVSKGGSNELMNIQLLCARHNLEKAAKVLDGVAAPMKRDMAAVLGRQMGMSHGDSDLVALALAGIEAGRGRDVFLALQQRLDHVGDPGSLLPAIESLPPGSSERSLLEARLACHLSKDAPKQSRALAGPLLAVRDKQVRATASLAMARAQTRLPAAERRTLAARAARSDDPYVQGCANLMLAELASGDTKAIERHLRRAADTIHPIPRSIAAHWLGDITKSKNEVTAESWFRRALITPDPETFAEVCVELAFLAPTDHMACAYATHALKAKAQDVRDRAHYVLGVSGCPEGRNHLELAAASKNKVIARLAKQKLDG